jgi:hypothetical protein
MRSVPATLSRETTIMRAASATTLIYLARLVEGIDSLTRFVDSYVRHPAGCAHRLMVIYKGRPSPGVRERADEYFRALSAEFCEVQDEMFDIGAYLQAASLAETPFVCFVNTHTEVIADNWLKQLENAIKDPATGLAGCHGSLESLRTSNELISKVVWLAVTQPEGLTERALQQFRFALSIHAPQCYLDDTRKGIANFRRMRGLIRNSRNIEDRWRTFWEELQMPGKPYHFLRDFPPFPNPHLRTNGFVVRRSELLEMFPTLPPTKEAAYGFESGERSLMRRLAERGRRSVVVCKDGKTWDQDSFALSGTFRTIGSSRSLISDNQTRRFDEMSAAEQAVHVRMTWGLRGKCYCPVETFGIQFGNASE